MRTMMSSPSETRASLILRLPDPTDRLAWDEFVAIYGPLVYRLARRQGLQGAAADDRVPEGLAAGTRSGQWLERPDRGSFRAWLLRIARNTAINFLTRPKHRPQALGGEDAMRAVTECVAEESDASREFDWEYRREVFRWAAEQVQAVVTDETWRAFWLTSVEEQSVSDTAERLGVSVGSVYIARCRVMNRLRELAKRFEKLDECDRP